MAATCSRHDSVTMALPPTSTTAVSAAAAVRMSDSSWGAGSATAVAARAAGDVLASSRWV